MTCSICNGLLALLGVLGNLAHFRCNGCGHESHTDAAEIDPLAHADCD